MIISKLKVVNFMPFKGEYILELDGDDLVAVNGEYEGSPKMSNRAGKSAFFEAVVYCLYGKTRAKKETELIHDSQTEMLVSLDLVEGDKTYTITRWRDESNKGGVHIKGTEGQKKSEAQPEIQKIIGMNYDEFLATAFFKQDDIDQFMESDPQKKKELMRGWVQQTNWFDYEEQSSDIKKQLTSELNSFKSGIADLDEIFDEEKATEEIAEIKLEIQKEEKKQKKLSDKKITVEMELKQLDTVSEKEAEIEKLKLKIADLKRKRPDGDKIQTALTEAKKTLAGLKPPTEDEYEEAKKKKDTAQRVLTEINIELRSLKNEAETLKTERTGICPILKEPCDRIKITKEYLADQEKKKLALETRKSKGNLLLEGYTETIENYEQAREVRRGMEGLESQTKIYKNIDEQIADIMKIGKKLRAEIPEDLVAKQDEIIERIELITNEATALNSVISGHNKKIGELEQKIKQNKDNEKKRKKYEGKIKDLEQQISDVTFVNYMFGKNGIPSIELENSYSEIEKDANFVLERMNAPFSIEFSATRDLGDWEPNCLECGHIYAKGTKTHRCPKCETDRQKKRKDELSLRVFENSKERPFYMDSGGGKIMLSVAIRIALTLLARRKTGTTWDVLFLDELFGKLDEVNRSNMAELIVKTLKEDLKFKQVFIISHNKEIQSATAKRLTIFRHKKGWSEMRME